MPEQQEEKKLGPNATYRDHDKSAKVVTVGGVMFSDGKPTNVTEAIGEAKAQELLKKLSKNKYFDVDGAEKQEQKKPEAQQPDPESARELIGREQALRAQGKHEEADKLVESGGQPQQGQAQSSGEPPPDYKAPEEATLETPPLPRGRK